MKEFYLNATGKAKEPDIWRDYLLQTTGKSDCKLEQYQRGKLLELV